MSGTKYFHVRGGVEQGPLTGAQLKQLAQTGRIGPNDLIRAEGRDKLYPAGSVVGLFTPEQLAGVRPPDATAPSIPAAPPQRSAMQSAPQQRPAAAPAQPASLPKNVLAGNDSPLVALLSSIVAVQRESLNDRVMQGRMNVAERDRQIAEMATLLDRVRQQYATFGTAGLMPQGPSLGSPAQAAPLPMNMPPSAPMNAGVDGLSLAAAALAGGALGYAASQSQAYSAPPPQPPTPQNNLASFRAATNNAFRTVTGFQNNVAPQPMPAPAMPPMNFPRPGGFSSDVLNQAGGGNNSWPSNPMPHTSQPPANSFGSSWPASSQPAWNPSPASPPIQYDAGSGGDWGGSAAPNSYVNSISPNTAANDGSGGSFFGDLFGTDDTPVSDVADAGDGGWLGGVEDAGGLLDGAGDVDVGDFDVGGFDF